MSNLVIVGMQWGDEGKGKIVDLLCPAFAAVARYQGGNNAGHTVKFGDRHFSLHLIPSGVLHAEQQCFLGNGMVIAPDALFAELEGLHEAGVETAGRLWISDRAQVLLPHHPRIDAAREEAAGARRIGTTSRGIGPAYEHKVSRAGIRVGELAAADLAARLEGARRRVASELGEEASFDVGELAASCRALAERLAPLACDVGAALHRLIEDEQPILFEGAQGTLLDVDHGTYPYVTSSNSTAGGACTGTGVPPTAIDGAIGVLKAYTTRVGEGPFPTELEGSVLEFLRERGHEYGTTTGRPRRCGWLDLVVARYAQRVNGIRSIALTKLDVLDRLDEIQVCVAYRIDGVETTELPASVDRLARVEPVYRTMPGWKQDTVGALAEDELPQAARDYCELIADEVGADLGLVSTGPRREETILTDGLVLRGWLGPRMEGVAAGSAGER